MSESELSIRPERPGGKGKSRKGLSPFVTGLLIVAVKGLCASLRLRSVGEEHYFGLQGGKILCLWHGRTIPLIARFRGVDITILISLSRDGETIAQVLDAFGYPALRGSSGPSGARVLAACIKLLRSGRAMAVTPDGPRGPARVLQPGVITMARKSGCALVPVGTSARPRLVLKSWDRYLLPLPFAKCLMVYGEPQYVPADADEATMEACRVRLEKAMRELQDEADRRTGVETYAEIARKTPL